MQASLFFILIFKFDKKINLAHIICHKFNYSQIINPKKNTIMEAFYFYGFWILLVILIVVVSLFFYGRNTSDVLKKKCEYLEDANDNLQQTRKESSDIFSFAVRFLVATSGKEIFHFKKKILHGDLSEDGSLERKAIDKIAFILEQEEPTE